MCVHSGHLQYGKAKRRRQNCIVCHSKRHANPEILLSRHYITPGLVGKLHLIVFTWFLYTYNILSCCALNSMLPPSFSTTEDTLLWYSGRALCRWRRTHIHTYTPTRTHTQLFPSLTDAHESSSLPALLAIASMCEWTTFSWGSSRSGQSRLPRSKHRTSCVIIATERIRWPPSWRPTRCPK